MKRNETDDVSSGSTPPSIPISGEGDQLRRCSGTDFDPEVVEALAGTLAL